MSNYGTALNRSHDLVNAAARKAASLAPVVAELAGGSGCTMGDAYVSALGPRQRKAYTCEAVALMVNAATGERHETTGGKRAAILRDAATLARSEGVADIAEECERVAVMWADLPAWEVSPEDDIYGGRDDAHRHYADDLRPSFAPWFCRNFGSISCEAQAVKADAGFCSDACQLAAAVTSSPAGRFVIVHAMTGEIFIGSEEGPEGFDSPEAAADWFSSCGVDWHEAYAPSDGWPVPTFDVAATDSGEVVARLVVPSCGHPALIVRKPAPLGWSGGTGYARLPEDDRTVCYSCADKMQRDDMAATEPGGTFVAYVESAADGIARRGMAVTTWTGGKLGTIVAAGPVQTGYTPTGGHYTWQAVTVAAAGATWTGRGPGAGMYVRLRRNR